VKNNLSKFSQFSANSNGAGRSIAGDDFIRSHFRTKIDRKTLWKILSKVYYTNMNEILGLNSTEKQ
jgi:hypothetical protein